MSDSRCSICRGECLTFNDARPIPNLGPVCGECNRRVVLPVRDLVWPAIARAEKAEAALAEARRWAEKLSAEADGVANLACDFVKFPAAATADTVAALLVDALAAEKARADKLEADCAALRAAVAHAEDVFDAYERYHRERGNDEKAKGNDQHRVKMTDALAATSPGAGWVSPEEHARALARAQEAGRSLFAKLTSDEAKQAVVERDAALAVKAQLLGALDKAAVAIVNGHENDAFDIARAAIAAEKGGAAC